MISTRRHHAIVERLRAEHERERKEWNRERGELVDRIMYISGKSWELPPGMDLTSTDIPPDDEDIVAEQALEFE